MNIAHNSITSLCHSLQAVVVVVVVGDVFAAVP